MITRLTASALALSLFASTLPMALAEDTSSTTSISVKAPTEVPCEGTGGKNRARCITDALKAWKELDHDYNKEEDVVIAAWKAEHAHMGIGSDYQTALRTFLNDMRAQRKEFQKQLQAFRKAFFAEQKTKREEGDGRSPGVKLEKTTLEAAAAICGPEDDDGAYRLCMRLQLRKKPVNVDRRSRTSPRLQKQEL